MKILKGIWKWLSGKKTAIGATANSVALWAFAKGMILEDDMVLIAAVLSAWTLIAVGHKVEKSTHKD